MTDRNVAGGPGRRQELGDQESSQLHPPHVDKNAQGAPVQQATQAPNDVPVLGANAGGSDKQSADQPRTIDAESMYDRRPAEDKDRDESDMP
jgi:hypothetical protein